MRFRTVLIDLDGTLVEHLPAIHRAYGHTLPQLGLPAPSYEQVKRAIGGGLPHAMRKFVPEERLEEALAIYRPYWERTMLDGVELMPGARELLEALAERAVPAAVFTNKHGPSARRVCEHLGVASLLRGIFGAGDTAWLKPEPEFAAHVVETLGASAADSVLIGDSPFDVAAAQAGGLAFAGVTTGTHTGDELRAAGATELYGDMHELARAWEVRK